MSKMLVACGVAASLVLPAGALAVKPVDRTNASKECRAERGTDPATQEAFRLKYGTNENGRNAFGKCVSQTAKEEAAERKAAKAKAVKECEAERGNGNAFGKCVSAKAKAIRRKQDAADAEVIEATKNAAKECDEERGDTAETEAAFQEKYGTNKNKKNAFGKCVSGKTHES